VIDPRRFRVLAIALGVWAAMVAARLAQVQLVQHAGWRSEAAEQSERVREVKEARGEIRTRDGRLLAGSLSSVSVCANPSRISRSQWQVIAGRLAPLVGLRPDQVLARFRGEPGYIVLARNLDPEIAPLVARLRQRGLWTERAENRVYPNHGLAGPAVGFVDADDVGQAGLERFYDNTLAGVPSEYRLLCDGKTLPTAIDLRLEKAGRPGRSLLLALDSRVQLVVEQELANVLDRVGGEGAAAVVMDPENGELLAVASLPAYDPGRPGAVPPETRRDRAVEDAIEPGSVFKPIMIAAGIASGAVQPHELVDCSGGGVDVAGVFMHDHASFGLLPVSEVIAKSSNAGAIRLAYRIAPFALDETIRSLGFGERTGVELPAETRGLYRGPRFWSALSRAGLALGEEITVSVVQVAQAYAVFANGGRLVHPRLVLETLEPDGTSVIPYRPAVGTQVLPPTVARQVTAMLEGVVDHGTGTTAAVPGYRVAGKTGTAQKTTNGKLRGGHHASWFAGFLPVDHPRFVIVVCVDQPRATYWATDVAAPAFGRIAARLVDLFGLPPSLGVST
jgi:cell division protein FtsI/penicillin-binding protein 2